MGNDEARYGWGSDFPTFRGTPARVIRGRLESFIRDASQGQIRAWDESIPPLHREVEEVLRVNEEAAAYGAILEYELPMESRRPDVILLAKSAVVLLELKGKTSPSQADIDQASAYARDLRCYHIECESRDVVPVVVPVRARGYLGNYGGVHVAGPDYVDQLVDDLKERPDLPPLTRARFLAESAYRPLPTLVHAARELFQHGELRTIKRARGVHRPGCDRNHPDYPRSRWREVAKTGFAYRNTRIRENTCWFEMSAHPFADLAAGDSYFIAG